MNIERNYEIYSTGRCEKVQRQRPSCERNFTGARFATHKNHLSIVLHRWRVGSSHNAFHRHWPNMKSAKMSDYGIDRHGCVYYYHINESICGKCVDEQPRPETNCMRSIDSQTRSVQSRVTIGSFAINATRHITPRYRIELPTEPIVALNVAAANNEKSPKCFLVNTVVNHMSRCMRRVLKSAVTHVASA